MYFFNEIFGMSTKIPRKYAHDASWQYFSIDSDNGLVPNRRQTNDDLLWWSIYASHGLNELKHFEWQNKSDMFLTQRNTSLLLTF